MSVSIHSLRKKGDYLIRHGLDIHPSFNPLPSQEGRQLFSEDFHINPFVSIHSLRKKGDLLDGFDRRILCVSIHSLRKKGDICYSEIPILNDVSIHSLRKKGDDSQEQDYAMIFTFQSTPFARRET